MARCGSDCVQRIRAEIRNIKRRTGPAQLSLPNRYIAFARAAPHFPPATGHSKTAQAFARNKETDARNNILSRAVNRVGARRRTGDAASLRRSRTRLDEGSRPELQPANPQTVGLPKW